MANLDRFAQGLPDAQDVKALETCQACSGEIYPGESVYIVGGYIIHGNLECLQNHVGAELTTIEDALEL